MILLIGGLGFIGMHTARRLLEVGEKVVVTWYSTLRMPDFPQDYVDKGPFVERMDATKTFEVFDVVRRHGVDSIIDLMAPPPRAPRPTSITTCTPSGCRTYWRPPAAST